MTGHAAATTAPARRPGPAWPGPRRPVDLRLVPAALAGWGATAAAVATGGRTAVAGTVLGCLLAVAAGAPLGRHDDGARPAWRRPRLRVAVALASLCAAAGSAVAGLHVADLSRGPLPALAERHGFATVQARTVGDPWQSDPPPTGEQPMGTVLLRAEVTQVTTDRGRTTAVRSPVLLVVRPSRPEQWLRLVPSTVLRLRVRAAPAPDTGPWVRDIAALLRVQQDGPPPVVSPPHPVQRYASTLRAGLRQAARPLPADARALLPALVVGDTSAVPADLERAFRDTDMLHLLAVSGANLTLVLMLLLGPPGTAGRAERGGLARRLGIPLRVTAALAALLTVAFVVVCRPEPSVLRAAVCGLVTVVAIGTGRRRSLVPALAAAVLLLVLYDPWLACDYGFLFSVLATGSLLLVAPRWSAAWRRRGVPGRLAEPLAAATAAQLCCAPVTVVLAGHVSLVAVPCNLAAEVAVAPATVLGFAALAAAPVSTAAAEALAWLAGWPAAWVAAVARTGAGLPGAVVDWPGGWGGAALLTVVLLAVLAVVRAGRRVLARPWPLAVCAVLALLIVLQPPSLTRVVTGWPPPHWRLVVCDVGQGDALVLAAGPGRAMVVDTGPDPVAVDRCLRRLGVTVVPLLVLTHFHADHVGGLDGVLRGRSVGAVQVSAVREPPGQAAWVERTARAARVPVVSAVPGERRRLGGLSWEVLWPPAPPHTGGLGANDASVTLLVRSAGLRLLLTGDLEPSSQRRLLHSRPDLPSVDVLKVAHHGSARQDARLLRRLRPGIAVISCGADNPYGHPAPATLALLRHLGSRVLRTDLHGAIAVTGSARDGPAAAVAG